MKLFESIRIAMRALAANKLRSVLTMLGIIIGVGAVIALMSIGRGVEKYVADQFNSLGSNLLFVAPGQITDGPPTRRGVSLTPLTLEDMRALGDRAFLPDVASVAAEYADRGSVARDAKELTISINGVTPSFAEVRNWATTAGQFFTATDFDERARVAVLGADAYTELFGPDEYPVDQTIRIENLNFRVIGVMEEKGGGPGGNLDESVFIPLSTAQDRLFKEKTVSGDYVVNVIYVSVVDSDRIRAAQEQIAEVLRVRRGISYLDDDDFSIVSQSDILSVFGDILGALTIFLGAIAGISLLVGGIGIMNIMLVSVTERTREIGLRKAVGAKRRDVLFQFLIEAVTLAVFGGMIGIVLGVTGAQGISRAFEAFDAVVGLDAVLLSLFFSMAVGLFFGIYPAFRASRLNPIDALRYE
jgi:putative ABC transport system permease protein